MTGGNDSVWNSDFQIREHTNEYVHTHYHTQEHRYTNAYTWIHAHTLIHTAINMQTCAQHTHTQNKNTYYKMP